MKGKKTTNRQAKRSALMSLPFQPESAGRIHRQNVDALVAGFADDPTSERAMKFAFRRLLTQKVVTSDEAQQLAKIVQVLFGKADLPAIERGLRAVYDGILADKKCGPVTVVIASIAADSAASASRKARVRAKAAKFSRKAFLRTLVADVLGGVTGAAIGSVAGPAGSIVGGVAGASVASAIDAATS